MRKLPLPPPEDEDGEGEGLLSVVAMYDFTAKEDTDLTLKQVLTHTHTHTHIHTHNPSSRCVMIQCVVSTGRRVHHPPQTRPAVVASAGQTWVRRIKAIYYKTAQIN